MSNNAKKAQSSLEQDLDIIHDLKKKIESRNSKFAEKLSMDIEKTYNDKKKDIEEYHNARVKEIMSYVNKKYDAIKGLAAKHEERMASYAKEYKSLLRKYEEIIAEKKKVGRMMSSGKTELKRYIEKAMGKAHSLKSVQKKELKKCRNKVKGQIDSYVVDKNESKKINKILSNVFQ